MNHRFSIQSFFNSLHLCHVRWEFSIPHLSFSSQLGGTAGGSFFSRLTEGGFAFLLLLLSTLQVHAADSILYKKLEHEATRTIFKSNMFASPALRNIINEPSISEIGLKGISQPSATARISQLGTGMRTFKVEATSLQHLGSNDLIWGNASYENGRKYSVVWNETSDFFQLYPYVMGDPKGGNMKYEEYELNGGYSKRIKDIFYGVELGYRALSEYRDHDPRPNNTVAELYGSLSFGYGFSKRYALAVNMDAGKYKQTNELAFYNELGAQKVFLLTGIANDFARFSGNSNNSFYKGYNLGISLSLAPRNGYGWMSDIGYTFTQRERILSDLNRMPLNKLKTDRFSACVALIRKCYGVRIHGEYSDRKGFDNLFGDPSGSVYPQIGTKEQYNGSVANITADGYWTTELHNGTLWSLEPGVGFCSISNKHKDSGNRFDSDNIFFKLKAEMDHIFGKNMIGMKANVCHRYNISSETDIYNACDPSLTTTIQQIGKYFDKGETSFGISAEYSRQIWGNKALSIAFGWQHALYLDGENNNCYEAKFAIIL